MIGAAARIGTAVVMAVGLIAANPSIGTAATNRAGTLDATFGHGGKVLTAFGGAGSGALVLANGDSVVTGSNGDGYGLLRYLPNGKIDPSYGNAGVAATPDSLQASLTSNLALQPDGKIIVAGSAPHAPGQASYTDLLVFRFNANGTLDPTFGTGGVVTTQFLLDSQPRVFESYGLVLIQPDGRILVGGVVSSPPPPGPGNYRGFITHPAIARYNADGTLDPTFASGGEAVSVGTGGVGALGLDRAGDIFAPTGTAVTELSPTGNFDTTATTAPLVATAAAGAEAFLPNGQYVVATGINIGRHGAAVQLERINTNGTQDPTFTSPAFHFAATPTDNASAIAVQPNGQVVVLGTSDNITTGAASFGLARVNTDGSLDASFGTAGVVATTFQGRDYATALALQANGNIVAAGNSENNTTGQSSLAIARYLGQ